MKYNPIIQTVIDDKDETITLNFSKTNPKSKLLFNEIWNSLLLCGKKCRAFEFEDGTRTINFDYVPEPKGSKNKDNKRTRFSPGFLLKEDRIN